MRYCGITRAPPNLPSHGQHGPRVLTHSALPGLQWPVGPCPQPSPPGGHPTAVAPAVVCAPLMFPISRSHSSPRPTPNWASRGCPSLPPLPPTNFTCLLAPVALAGDGVVAVYCCDPASWLGSICVQHAPSSLGCVRPVDFAPPVSEHDRGLRWVGEPPPGRGHARPNLFSRTDAGVRSRPATPSPPQRLIARCLGEASGGNFGRGTFRPVRGAATHRSGTVSAASWGRGCGGARARRGAQSGLG